LTVEVANEFAKALPPALLATTVTTRVAPASANTML
jgi:hypothetical protein